MTFKATFAVQRKLKSEIHLAKAGAEVGAEIFKSLVLKWSGCFSLHEILTTYYPFRSIGVSINPLAWSAFPVQREREFPPEDSFDSAAILPSTASAL